MCVCVLMFWPQWHVAAAFLKNLPYLKDQAFYRRFAFAR